MLIRFFYFFIFYLSFLPYTKVDSYERYILECEEKEKRMLLVGDGTEEQNVDIAKKWKERRECLDMLRKELKKIEDGDEINYEDYLSELVEEAKDEVNEEDEDEEKECAKTKRGEGKDGRGKKREKEEEKMEEEEEEVTTTRMTNFEKGGKLKGKKCSSKGDDDLSNMNLLIGKVGNDEKEEEMIKKDK